MDWSNELLFLGLWNLPVGTDVKHLLLLSVPWFPGVFPVRRAEVGRGSAGIGVAGLQLQEAHSQGVVGVCS